MPKKILTPGFVLLATALMTLVGGLIIILAWLNNVEDNIIIMFDLITTSIVLLSLFYTEYRLSVIALVASLPLFTTMRHVRLLTLLDVKGIPLVLLISTVARLVYSFRAMYRAWRLGKGLVLGVDSTLVQLAMVSLIAIVSGASVVYISELPDPRSPIKSFGDALWWAIATATTVGYGDVVPVTKLGRLTASILMVIGIGSLGVFISDMAVRVARILMIEDYEDMPVLEREKRRIVRAINRIEDLSDEELEILLRKIRVLHLLIKGGKEDSVLEVIVDNISKDPKTSRIN